MILKEGENLKMIIDTKNCREIHFGNGTLSLGHDISGTIEIIYEKTKNPCK